MEAYEVVFELRLRALRVIEKRGEDYFPYVNSDDNKERTARVGEFWLKLISGRQLLVGIPRTDGTVPDKILYDSDRVLDYQNVHVIEHVLLPALRKEMVLDDLAGV